MDVESGNFRTFESDLSLFDLRVDGSPVWERIRFKVWREITEQTGRGQAHTGIEKDASDYLRGGHLFAKNLLVKNPFLADEADVMYFGHPRRKKAPDGYWWDLYCDPIHEKCDFEYVHFESDHRLEHLSPAKTENLRYLDLINYGSTIQRLLGASGPAIPSWIDDRLAEAEAEIQNRFNAEVDLRSLVRRQLDHRRTKLWLYKRLLRRVDPDIVVVVVSYGNHNVIEVCKQEGIPVVELQHGVIHRNHLGYSFPEEASIELFPDYLLVWGNYWKTSAHLPIREDRVSSVGFPYMEQRKQDYAGVSSNNQILFISQGTIGAQLSRFACEVNAHPSVDHDVIYKLHPGEYDRWQDEYPWLVGTDFEIVDNSKPPLYKLFVESSVQIGVGSTAIYEGLCFDLETYVYDCPGSSVLEPLVDEGAAELVSSVEELASSLGTGKMTFNREYYFQSNATENACQALRWLAREGTSRGFGSR